MKTVSETVTANQLLGFVVVEWNQASSVPDLTSCPLFEPDDRESAELMADLARDRAAEIGRGERYAVCAVRLTEEPR